MSKPQKPKVTHRAADLVFPTDQFGFTSRFKKEALASIYRLRAHPEKKKIFDETLALLQEFADAKYAYDVENPDVGYVPQEPVTEAKPENKDGLPADAEGLFT